MTCYGHLVCHVKSNHVCLLPNSKPHLYGQVDCLNTFKKKSSGSAHMTHTDVYGHLKCTAGLDAATLLTDL